MTTLLVVTGNPSQYTTGNWPATAMNSGVWEFTFTTTDTSASGTYGGFNALFSTPIIGGTSGGLWIVSERLELYDVDDNLIFSSGAMVFGSGAVLRFKINDTTGQYTISGATSGNGTFSYTQSGPYFRSAETLGAGEVPGSSGFELPGTFGNITDGVAGESISADAGSFALTGGAANLLAGGAIVGAAGAFALTGGAADLEAGATGSTIVGDAGSFSLSGAAADVLAVARVDAAAGSFTLAGGVAELLAGSAVLLGDHGIDHQDFPFSTRDALVSLDTQPTGSIVLIFGAGHSAELTLAWTDNKANTIRKLSAVQDYPDFAGYGTQTGVTNQPMTGGTAHEFTVQVANDDESTVSAAEVIGGRRVKFLHAVQGNTGATTTQSIGPITTDGPAVLFSAWWGSAPVTPPFVDGVGTPFTAVPDNGFAVIESYLVNNEFGEIQHALAARAVDTAGSFSVEWTHSPAQGAQLWLVAVEPAAEVGAEAGAFTLTGGAADLGATANATIDADAGSLALSGGAASLLADAVVTADPGSFALSGGAADPLAASEVDGGAGGFALAGADAGLLAGGVVQADAGALALTGGAADLLGAAAVVAAPGAFTLTGGEAVLASAGDQPIDADAGSFELGAGGAAIMAVATIEADPGAFVLAGGEATFADGQVDPIAGVEDAIYAWVVAGSGLAAGQVIWSDSGPTPAGTYISMRIIATNRVSDDWLVSREVGGEIVHHVRGTRHPTLELTCVAGARTGSNRPEMILERVLTAIRLPSVIATMRAGGVGVGPRGRIRIVNVPRSTMFDPRAVVEIGLHIEIDISEAGSSIERALTTTPGRAATWIPDPPP